MEKIGRVKDEDLVSLVENATFGSVQLNFPRDGKRFSDRFMEALGRRYRVAAQLRGSLVLMPVE
jgi:hypothetical protein